MQARAPLHPVAAGLLVSLVFLSSPPRARAVRPFLTDDARTVGGGNAQLETWAVVDAHGGEHWVTASVGPLGPLELASGLVWGGTYEGAQDLSLVGPLLMGKLLLRPTRSDTPPGLALAVGALGPHVGRSPIERAWSAFGYMALSQSFYEDDLLFHVNLGLTVNAGTGAIVPIGGAGVQGRLVGPFALVAEVFHGDALDATNEGWTVQAGTRLLLSDAVQLDATGAVELHGATVGWFATAGVRLVAEHVYPEPRVADGTEGEGTLVRYDRW
jgi:xanthosine utilization system XapX-like protein